MHDPFAPSIPLGDALRALPAAVPPADGWQRMQARLAQAARQRRQRHLRWAFAAAASVLLALTPLVPGDPAPAGDTAPAVAAATAAPAEAAPADPLQALIQESAQLEALLALTADDPLRPAEIAALNAAYADRLQWIDTVLASADAPASTQVPLWRERVLLLRRMAGIETSQQLLAAQGDSAASLVATF